MDTQKSLPFRQLASFTLALAVLGAILNGAVGTGAADQMMSDQKHKESYDVIIAQNETPKVSDDDNAASSEKEDVESSRNETDASSGAEKGVLKNFRPSEQIEAEQAVDFPYDI